MYLKILACDLDGTLAEHGEVAPATWDALREARKAGLTLMLVTGRRLDTFAADGPFAEVFEAIVAEDGAALYFTRNDSVVLPFGRLAPEVWRRLDALNLPLERGIAIASTWVPHDAAVAEVLRETGGSATLEYNKGAVMVLPPGATKDLERGDFERWLREVIRDEELARRLRKIRHRHPPREHVRETIVTAVADRYEELESLI